MQSICVKVREWWQPIWKQPTKLLLKCNFENLFRVNEIVLCSQFAQRCESYDIRFESSPQNSRSWWSVGSAGEIILQPWPTKSISLEKAHKFLEKTRKAIKECFGGYLNRTENKNTAKLLFPISTKNRHLWHMITKTKSLITIPWSSRAYGLALKGICIYPLNDTKENNTISLFLHFLFTSLHKGNSMPHQ